MAWVEQVGKRAWRMRCRNGDGTTLSLSGFRSRTAAEDFTSDMEADRRRGVWPDPSGAATLVAEWVEMLDVSRRKISTVPVDEAARQPTSTYACSQVDSADGWVEPA